MRLSNLQRQSIVNIIYQQMGNKVTIWLFGSRVDDAKKGGDVDLLIECVEKPNYINEINAVRLIRNNIGLPVDVIVRAAQMPETPFHQIAKRTGVIIQ